MTNLELITKAFFEKFSVEQTGRVLNWFYLPIDRRKAWMDDTLRIANFVITEIDSTIVIKPISNSIGNTMFTRGKEEGIQSEKLRIKMQLQDFLRDLKQELEEYGS